MSIQYHVGDTFEVMKTLEPDSVDLIMTSPPFLALRSYLPADHPDKSKEIGSEATPAEYVDVLLRLTAEWRRLLAPHGSLVVELGDTYSGSGGAGGDYGDQGLRDGQPKVDGSGRRNRPTNVAAGILAPTNRPGPEGRDRIPGWPLAKSLTLIPETYRFALAYGINPHTGASSPAGQWRFRNAVRWVRPNPPVGALGDKFRPATSELVVACTLKDRWFDLDAVREINNPDRLNELDSRGQKHTEADGSQTLSPPMGNGAQNPAGGPPLDWWKISPKGYSGAHYAVFPSELCVKPIKAMCPREVCRTCGQPRRRIVEHERPQILRTSSRSRLLNQGGEFSSDHVDTVYHTLGWSDCGHDDYRAGLVLDPFAGTGTTLAVAHGHGRDAIGIDIDERSAELARDRVGPLFLEVIGDTDWARL